MNLFKVNGELVMLMIDRKISLGNVILPEDEY